MDSEHALVGRVESVNLLDGGKPSDAGFDIQTGDQVTDLNLVMQSPTVNGQNLGLLVGAEKVNG
ncbi:hypothetical protein ACTNEV_11600, partial [Oscillospiraceae bacterium HCP3S3_D12]